MYTSLIIPSVCFIGAADGFTQLKANLSYCRMEEKMNNLFSEAGFKYNVAGPPWHVFFDVPLLHV